MISIKKSLALFILLWCILSHKIYANVEKIKSLNDIFSYIQPQTLIIFDLHHSLIHSEQMLGHEHKFSSLITDGLEQNFSFSEAYHAASSQYNLWHSYINFTTTDKDLPFIISTLHHNQIITLAYTNKHMAMADVLYKQLQSLGIDLNNLKNSTCDFLNTHRHILCLPYHDTIEELYLWLVQHHSSFSKFIFISTRLDILQHLDRRVDPYFIKYLGLHYLKDEPLYEPKVAKIQEDHLYQLLTNEEAALLLNHRVSQ